MLIGVAVITYLLPTLIAVGRRSRWLSTIAVINIVLGWTGLGWIWAAAMAIDRTPHRALTAIAGEARHAPREQGYQRHHTASSLHLHVVQPATPGSRADVA